MNIFSIQRAPLCMTAAVIFASVVLPSQAGANEIIPLDNPSFEEVGPEGLVGWRTQRDPAHASRSEGVETKAEFKQDLENVKDGNASALILHEGPRWAGLVQRVSLENGAHYRLRVFAKTDILPPNSVRLAVRLSKLNDDREEEILLKENSEHPSGMYDFQADGEWHEIIREFTVPDTFVTDQGADLQLRAILRNLPGEPVSIWFDDVTLERIESSSGQ